MKPAPFDYHAPETLDGVLQLLTDLDDAKVLAGGQSFIPLLRRVTTSLLPARRREPVSKAAG